MPVLVPTSPNSTLVSDLIEQTRRLVYGTSRVELNRVASDIDEEQETILLTFDLQGAVRGNVISINDELMYVMDAIPNTKTITVRRAYYGTNAEGHAAGDLVEINPRFPKAYIRHALQREIDSWAPRLYKVVAANVSTSTINRVYDLTGLTPFLHVIDVRSSPFSGRSTRPYITRWTIAANMDHTDYPSGSALQILSNYPASGTLRVRVAQAFDVSEFADTVDVVADIGLGTSMLDIPPVGAAWRLMSGREIARTNPAAQPEPRRAEETPPGHMINTAAQMKQLRDQRLGEEISRLRSQYPVRGVA